MKQYNVNGLKVTSIKNQELRDYIENILQTKNQIVCYGYSFGAIPNLRRFPQVAEYANKFEISICDGRGFYWFVRLLGYKIESKISIPQMADLVLEVGNKNGYSFMILGSTKENNERASKNVQNRFKNLKVLPGYDGGWFTEEDNKKSVKVINQNKPDILFVCVSSPKKVNFTHKYRKELSNTSIIVPCGGYVDILSGKSKRMPKFVKNMGLAFLYRFIQEPRRLFRDSILNSLESLLLIVPLVLIKGKSFSIPKFYSKKFNYDVK